MSEQEIYEYRALIERVAKAILARLQKVQNHRAITEADLVDSVTSSLGCSAQIVEETIEDLREGMIETRIHDGERWVRGLGEASSFVPHRVNARIPAVVS